MQLVLDLFMVTSGQEEVCLEIPWADLDLDCRVDIDDFAWMAGFYLTDDWWSDLNGSALVDLGDVIMLLDEWLECNMYPTCVSP